MGLAANLWLVWEWLVGAHPALIGSDNLLVLLFGKGDVRPGRLLASLVVFGFFYLLVTVAWRPLYRTLGWLLMPLGENALYAYAAHILLVALVGVVVLILGPLGRGSNTLLTLWPRFDQKAFSELVWTRAPLLFW